MTIKQILQERKYQQDNDIKMKEISQRKDTGENTGKRTNFVI